MKSAEPTTEYPSAQPASESGRPNPKSLNDAFARLRQHWREVREFFNHYFLVQLDRILLSIKMLMVYAVLGALVLIGLGALLVTAAVQVCYGISHLLTQAFGGRVWLGELVTGAVIWILVLATAYIGISSLIARSRRATMEKYEQRRAKQRSDIGYDAQAKANE